MASRALSCTHHNRFASKLLRVLHHPTASEATAERARCVSATTAVGPAPRCYITQQPTRIAVRGPLLVRNLTNNTAALLNQYTTNDDSTAAKSTEESDTTNTSRSQDSDTTNTTRSTDDSDSSTSSGSSSSEDDAEYASVDHIRRAILNASLNYVHEHGWTHAAIAKGAEELGYSSMAHGIVEGGGAELFLHLQQRLNEQLEQQLISWTKEGGQPQMSFVEAALKHRLELVVPWLGVWSQGVVTTLLSPHHTPDAVRKIAELADHVCHYAGHVSTGTSWYTERVSVAAVYKASELCLLQDKSQHHQDTWQFLHRRATEMERCSFSSSSLETLSKDASQIARAAVLTGLNMAGFNNLSR